jgi:hypothetical protein
VGGPTHQWAQSDPTKGHVIINNESARHSGSHNNNKALLPIRNVLASKTSCNDTSMGNAIPILTDHREAEQDIGTAPAKHKKRVNSIR